MSFGIFVDKHRPAERDAFPTRYPAMLSGIRAFLRKRAPPEDVDDLVQEVAVRMELRKDDQEIVNPTGYVFQIARNVLIDRARSDQVRARSSHESLTEMHCPVEDRSPERVLIAKDQLDRVMTALEYLPDRTRQAFVLHRFEEMSHAQIASHMAVSVSAVEKHIMRAMRILAAQFED